MENTEKSNIVSVNKLTLKLKSKERQKVKDKSKDLVEDAPIIRFDNFWSHSYSNGQTAYIYLNHSNFVKSFINHCNDIGVRIDEYRIYHLEDESEREKLNNSQLTEEDKQLFNEFTCVETTIVSNDSQLFETQLRALRCVFLESEIQHYGKALNALSKLIGEN
jgi:hypothetical protein